MKIIIKKGRHYPCSIPLGLPFWVKKKGKTSRKRSFKFTGSCMFNIHDEDQWDVNKLFGFSIGNHHDTSFRFGWRPILSENLIEIVAYEYHDEFREKTMPICRVELNKWYKFSITYDNITNKSIYIVNEICFSNKVEIQRKYGWGHTLGIYFGGSKKAPQDIIIYKKRR